MILLKTQRDARQNQNGGVNYFYFPGLKLHFTKEKEINLSCSCFNQGNYYNTTHSCNLSYH